MVVSCAHLNLAETGFGNHFLRALVVATTVAVLMAFSTGEAFRPGLIGAVVTGAGVGGAVLAVARRWVALAGAAGLSTALSHTGIAPVQMGAGTGLAGHIASGALSGLPLACPWPVPGLADGGGRARRAARGDDAP